MSLRFAPAAAHATGIPAPSRSRLTASSLICAGQRGFCRFLRRRRELCGWTRRRTRHRDRVPRSGHRRRSLRPRSARTPQQRPTRRGGTAASCPTPAIPAAPPRTAMSSPSPAAPGSPKSTAGPVSGADAPCQGHEPAAPAASARSPPPSEPLVVRHPRRTCSRHRLTPTPPPRYTTGRGKAKRTVTSTTSGSKARMMKPASTGCLVQDNPTNTPGNQPTRGWPIHQTTPPTTRRATDLGGFRLSRRACSELAREPAVSWRRSRT